MAEKKPNRIQALLGTAPTSKAPLARELGEEDENPAEMDGGGDDDAKAEIGAEIRSALEGKDDLALYEAVCKAYRFEESGSSGGGSGPEDAEEPYGGESS